MQDTVIELIIAIAKSVKSSPRIPFKKNTGIKTITVVVVEPIFDLATSSTADEIISKSDKVDF